jgi:regulator of replication initiation timing
MSLETISRKKLNELEQQIRQLLVTIKSAKLQNEPLVELLQAQALELEKIRHEQFDEANTEYHTY